MRASLARRARGWRPSTPPARDRHPARAVAVPPPIPSPADPRLRCARTASPRFPFREAVSAARTRRGCSCTRRRRGRSSHPRAPTTRDARPRRHHGCADGRAVEQQPQAAIRHPALHGECSLGRRRQHLPGREDLGDVTRQAQPAQPGIREHDGIEVALEGAVDARRHVAAQRHDGEVRPQPLHLRGTASAARADGGAPGQRRQRAAATGAQRPSTGPRLGTAATVRPGVRATGKSL